MRAHRLRASVVTVLVAAVSHAAIERVDGPRQRLRYQLDWYVYRSFETADGLPHPWVNALVQDRTGFLFAATAAGLARYDGVGWEMVPLPPPIPVVRALLVDDDDAVLVGTEGDGLWRLEAGTREARRVHHPRLGTAITDLARAGDGGVWVASELGLLHCRGVACRTLPATDGLPVYRVLEGRWRGQSVLWLGVEGEGVRRIDDPLGPDPRCADLRLDRTVGLPNNAVRALVQWGGERGEDLWIGCGRGLARWNGERLVVYRAEGGFPAAMVFAFAPTTSVSGRPQLVAALRPGGLAIFSDDGAWSLDSFPSGLPSNDIQSLFISSSSGSRGYLWIGTTDAGVARRDPGQFMLLDERIGIPSRNVYGVGAARFPDGEESLWVGTEVGARRWRQGEWRPFMPAGYEERIVRDLVAGDDGRLWAATDRQLLAFSGHTVEEFNVDNSPLPAVNVNRLARLGHGDEQEIWIATNHGLARFAHGRLVVGDWGGGAIPSGTQILALVEDPALSRVWVGLPDGLAKIDADGVRRVRAPCLTGVPVVDIAPGEGGRVFVATRGAVFALRPGAKEECQRLPLEADTGVIAGLVSDRLQRLYVFSSRLVQRLSFEGERVVSHERFDQRDGLRTANLRPGRALWVDAENRIYAATAAGLTGFEPEAYLPETEPARLLVHGVRADGQVLRDGDVLPAHANTVHFVFRLLSFQREHRIRYSTELQGLPNSRAQWWAGGSRVFERLPPGKYTFLISARAADGQRVGPVRVGFSVQAPWWQRWWAATLAAAFLAMSGVALARWREAVATRRARHLERVVAERTRELAEANKRLELASLTDPLTGLANRRGFAVATEGVLERAARRLRSGDRSAHLLLILIDLDHFKTINDSWGHGSGDRVLEAMARRIEGVGRAGDVVARLGGEEFVLLAHDVEPSGASRMLKRCLHAIAGVPIELEARTLAVTASLGAVTVPSPFCPDSWETALEVADDALYTAKQTGRDRACLVIEGGKERTIAGRPMRTIVRVRGGAAEGAG